MVATAGPPLRMARVWVVALVVALLCVGWLLGTNALPPPGKHLACLAVRAGRSPTGHGVSQALHCQPSPAVHPLRRRHLLPGFEGAPGFWQFKSTSRPAPPLVSAVHSGPTTMGPLLPHLMLVLSVLCVVASWVQELSPTFRLRGMSSTAPGHVHCAAVAGGDADAPESAGPLLLKSRPFILLRPGEVWPIAEGRAFCCGGLVEGESPGDHVLHLSPWPGNRTPDRFYADTGTEMALKFMHAVKDGQDKEAHMWGARFPPPAGVSPESLVGSVAEDPCKVAPVLNTQFHTDGLLSAFVMLQPEKALPHAVLLSEAAAAGDFDEWPSSDAGLKLQFAIQCRATQLLARRSPFQDGSKQDAWLYRKMLGEVATIVEAVAAGQGEELWGEMFNGCDRYYRELADGAVYTALLEHNVKGEMEEVTDLNEPWEYAPRLGLVVHPVGYDGLVFFHAIHRRFFGRGNKEFKGAGVERYLLVTTESQEEVEAREARLAEAHRELAASCGMEDVASLSAQDGDGHGGNKPDAEGEGGSSGKLLYTYLYRRPGHAWAQTRERFLVPNPENVDALADTVSKQMDEQWIRDTQSLTTLIKSLYPMARPPDDILPLLLVSDLGMNCSFDLWK
eukprot:GGOE01001527.1.p1 GENE.GGOE01001527.1~~GGOE01001527.1.p1  ORF type:complete len:627 (+),score=120.50 GGOE01001527.1:25-1881(+)